MVRKRMGNKKILIAVSGASGAIYAENLIDLLKKHPGLSIALVFSKTAISIYEDELEINFDEFSTNLINNYPNITFLDNSDFHTSYASGSNCASAMIIIPASMGCIGRIASGVSSDLISRAADVMLKERKPLFIIPRESPLNLIHLRNLCTLCEAGAQIIPACPTFYDKPKSIEEVVSRFSNRLISKLGLEPLDNSYKYLNY